MDSKSSFWWIQKVSDNPIKFCRINSLPVASSRVKRANWVWNSLGLTGFRTSLNTVYRTWELTTTLGISATVCPSHFGMCEKERKRMKNREGAEEKAREMNILDIHGRVWALEFRQIRENNVWALVPFSTPSRKPSFCLFCKFSPCRCSFTSPFSRGHALLLQIRVNTNRMILLNMHFCPCFLFHFLSPHQHFLFSLNTTEDL